MVICKIMIVDMLIASGWVIIFTVDVQRCSYRAMYHRLIPRMRLIFSVLSPVYLSTLQAFSTEFPLMWEARKETKRFDVTTGHSHHAMHYSWGEH